MSTLTNKILLCALSLNAIPAFAQDSQSESLDFNWGGFITQGWTHSSANEFFGESSKSGGSFDFREVGLYSAYRISPEFRVSGQLLSRLAGQAEEGNVNVDYLIFDWSIVQDPDLQAGFRIGRIKNALGFYNETRDTAFTRTGALLPQSLYQDRIRDISLSSDGIGGYLRKSTDIGYLSFDLQLGRPQASTSTELALLGRDWAGEYDDSSLILFRALYETPTNDFRFALTAIDSTLPFDSGSTDPFADSTVDFSLLGLSAQWNSEYWTFTSEVTYQRLNRIGFGSVYSIPKSTGGTYYLQLDHRLTAEWTAFIRYDVFYADLSDRDGKAYETSTGLPAFQQYAKDWAVGVGYQPSQNWLLRAEWHHVEGAAWLSALDNPVTSDIEEYWDLAILQASFRF